MCSRTVNEVGEVVILGAKTDWPGSPGSYEIKLI